MFPAPHFDEGADDGADHMLEKSIGIGVNLEPFASAENGKTLKAADRIGVVGEASLERREVVATHEERSGLLHRGLVQWGIDVPGESAIHGWFGRSIEDTVSVEFTFGIVSSVKRVRHQGCGLHGNILRQHGIERPHPVECKPITFGTKTGHLSNGMHTGVGAAGADDGGSRLADPLDGLFHSRLNRRLIGLTLPTGIAGPVVFED